MGADVLTGTQDQVTEEAVEGSATKRVPAGSVAVVTRSGILERTIPIALVPFEITLNQDMKAVVPHEGIDPRWVAWGLRAFERALLQDTRKAGTTVASIEMSRFHAFELPIPPLDEQRHIVHLLEDHLSRLDAADGYIDAAQQRTELLSGQLLVNELAAVRCDDVSLGELLVSGLSNGKSVPTREGGFPVLRLTALRDGRIDLAQRKEGAWTANDAARFLVRRRDFLISRGNGSLRLVGRGGLVDHDPDDVAFPDTLIRARPDPSRLLPDFMALVWNSPTVRRQIEGAARTTAGIYKVNQKDLGAIRLAVPSLNDQQQIHKSISSSRNGLAALSHEVERVRIRSAGLRRSLLAAAFSGRLTGNGQDPERDQRATL